MESDGSVNGLSGKVDGSPVQLSKNFDHFSDWSITCLALGGVRGRHEVRPFLSSHATALDPFAHGPTISNSELRFFSANQKRPSFETQHFEIWNAYFFQLFEENKSQKCFYISWHWFRERVKWCLEFRRWWQVPRPDSVAQRQRHWPIGEPGSSSLTCLIPTEKRWAFWESLSLFVWNIYLSLL